MACKLNIKPVRKKSSINTGLVLCFALLLSILIFVSTASAVDNNPFNITTNSINKTDNLTDPGNLTENVEEGNNTSPLDQMINGTKETMQGFSRSFGGAASSLVKPVNDLASKYFGVDFSQKNITISDLKISPSRRDTYYIHVDRNGAEDIQYATYTYETNRQVDNCNIVGIYGANCTKAEGNVMEVTFPVNSSTKYAMGQVQVSDILTYTTQADLMVRILHLKIPTFLERMLS